MRRLLCLLALQATASLAAGSAASCSKFTPSGSYYKFTAAYESYRNATTLPASVVQTSNAYACTQGGQIFGPPETIVTCSTSGGECRFSVPLNNAFNVWGYTNLSLGHAAAAPLFSLLPAQSNGDAAPPQHYCALVDPSPNIYSFCFYRGTTIYSVYVPTFTCINGTLSGCSDGPVADGTAAQICGITLNPYTPGAIEGSISEVNLLNPSKAPHWAGSQQCSPSAAPTVRAGVFGVVAAAVAAAALLL